MGSINLQARDIENCSYKRQPHQRDTVLQLDQLAEDASIDECYCRPLSSELKLRYEKIGSYIEIIDSHLLCQHCVIAVPMPPPHKNVNALRSLARCTRKIGLVVNMVSGQNDKTHN